MSLQEKIEALKEQDYGVEIEHVRNTTIFIWDGEKRESVNPKGGFTKALILDSDDNVVAQGEARCSMEDNYNRKTGALIALGRAEKALNKPQFATGGLVTGDGEIRLENDYILTPRQAAEVNDSTN